ncbi:methionine synthase vitamin-B12 independent [Penicillium taxi]|uniref:methionine synthase vitamin-B12 independent n=1 Tax=Penicillium taxi TaxID=168475 RepID=UPI0025454462|nr:methionine synthase vitamin-B12 independent [Penicillium taxi]KAJ5894627.1 methionine synthase vitamin-B12 independent [Penicillium taxi]
MTSQLHSAPLFRAELMSSLLRPEDLLNVRAMASDMSVPGEQPSLAAVEKKSIANVVRMQQEAGFKAVTSGEFNRTRFWGLMWDKFEGTIRLQDAEASMFRLYHPDVVGLIEQDRKVMPGDSVIAGSKLSWNPSRSLSNLHELRLVQQALPESEWSNIKLTMITPAWFHMRYKQGKTYTSEAYANDAEYFQDVAKVYQAELDALYKAGLRNVQFDDPRMAYFCSSAFLDLYNDCIAKIPTDMHPGIHLCRGNFIGGRQFAEGSYDVIAQKLFENLNVNKFYLEYDTERAGGFEPLKYLPKNKNFVVGIISTKISELEGKEAMKERIYSAADFIASGSGETREEALKCVCISPQCGFNTHESGYPLSFDDERNKLCLVRQIADEIWGEALVMKDFTVGDIGVSSKSSAPDIRSNLTPFDRLRESPPSDLNVPPEANKIHLSSLKDIFQAISTLQNQFESGQPQSPQFIHASNIPPSLLSQTKNDIGLFQGAQAHIAHEQAEMVLKISPGHDYNSIIESFAEEIKTKLRAMGFASWNGEFEAIDSARIYGDSSCKEPAWGIAPKNTTNPSLVLEVGFSKSYASLRNGAAWWYSNVNTKAVVLISVSYSPVLHVAFEVWYEVSNPSLGPSTKSSPQQVLECTQRAQYLDGQIKGGPLSIPFDSILHRPPRGIEQDIILSPAILAHIGAEA